MAQSANCLVTQLVFVAQPALVLEESCHEHALGVIPGAHALRCGWRLSNCGGSGHAPWGEKESAGGMSAS